jgi:Flp pilus assembly protein TadD
MAENEKIVDHFELGNAALADNKLDTAVEEFREALKSREDFAEAHNNLGLALFYQSRFDDAIAAFRNALKIEPDFPLAHANLGLALLNKELVAEAIEELSKAVELNPEIAEAHYNLGIAYTRIGNDDEAIKAYEAFVKYAGENYRNYVEGVERIISQMKAKKVSTDHS